MKIFKIVGLMMIALIIFSSSKAHANISKKEIEQLIENGEKQAAVCNDKLEEIKKLDKKFDERLTFPNKKLAFKAMQMLKKYKGTPDPTQELMDRLVTASPRSLDMKWLSDVMNKTLVCNPEIFNSLLTKLVRSARTFKFRPKEKHILAQLILDDLKHEASFPTHLGLLAPYILILDGLVDQKAVKMTVPAALKREELHTYIQSGLEKLKQQQIAADKAPENKELQTKNFLAQVRDTEKVRIKFLEFLEAL